METRLFEEGSFPFTDEWYADRPVAHHLEEGIHQDRMALVALLAAEAVRAHGYTGIVDLGAGDGGMLQLLHLAGCPRWGYEHHRPNVDHAIVHRDVDMRLADFTKDQIEWGDLVVITEVLEHLETPHEVVRRIAKNARAVVASSPSRETAEAHDGCHAWVWDMDGYRAMFEDAGFTVIEHIEVTGGYDFQILHAITS